MKPSDVVRQFEDRSRAAGRYREFAALFLVFSLLLFGGYILFRTRIGVWEGALLAVGVVTAVVTAALALLSVINLRCPNCDRIVGEVFGAAYCPACGAALKPDVPLRRETAETPGRRTAAKASGKRSLAAGLSGRVWEPRSGIPGVEDYPEEAYPKNIRMFTTTDEGELTKRYIRLIDKDNRESPVRQGQISLPGGGARPARLPRPAADAASGKKRSRPNWRRPGQSSPEEEPLGWFGRFVNRLFLRRL
jgi:hypothetical protein